MLADNNKGGRQPNSKVAFVGSAESGVLCAKSVEQAVAMLGGMSSIISPGDRVLIKPNLVAPFERATTQKPMIEAVIEQVRRSGAEPVIAESSGFEFDTEQTFEALGMNKFAKRLDVKLLNLDKCEYLSIARGTRAAGEFIISKVAIESDVIINLPRLKLHSQTDVTIGIKNLFGLLKRDTRRVVHTFGLDRGIAELALMLRPALTIVDASTLLSRAVFGPEEPQGGLAASRDVLAVDSFCCRLIGMEPDSVRHICLARQLGVGRDDYELVGDVPNYRSSRGSSFSGVRSWMHRAAYQAMYGADLVCSSLFKQSSLIPYFHYYLGLRPVINREKCDSCGECAKECPINAISLEKKAITSTCMHLRCMRCVEACPRKAIEIRRTRLFG